MRKREKVGYQRCRSVLLALIGMLLSAEGVLAQPDTLWTRRYDSGGYDRAEAVTTDRDGNIIVTGWSGVDSCTWLTIKYSSSGDTLWARRYAGGTCASDVAIDDSGNIIVTGDGLLDSCCWVTIKHSPSGDTLWTREYDGRGCVADVAVDDSGNVIVVSHDSDTASWWITIKYNPLGDTFWTRRHYAGYNADYDLGSPADVAIDDSGNIVIVGAFHSPAPFQNDYHMIKYTPSGDTVWTRTYASEGFDRPAAGALDDSGNVIIVGWMNYDCSGFYGYWIMKYNPFLEDTVWLRCFKEGHTPYDAVVDDSGNIVVTGVFLATIKCTPSGDIAWNMSFDGGCGYGIAVDDSGHIIVAGSCSDGPTADWFVMKYGAISGVEENNRARIEKQQARLTVAPNPFTHNTVMEFGVRSSQPEPDEPLAQEFINEGFLAFRIYDLSGRLVRTLQINKSPNQQINEVSWDGRDRAGQKVVSGPYFITVSTTGFKQTQKVVIIY
jgi:hypothetical protein